MEEELEDGELPPTQPTSRNLNQALYESTQGQFQVNKPHSQVTDSFFTPAAPYLEALATCKDILLDRVLHFAPEDKKNDILDLINIFREYTEKGQVRRQQQKLHTQINTLDSLITAARALNKPARVAPTPAPAPARAPGRVQIAVPHQAAAPQQQAQPAIRQQRAPPTAAQVAANGNPSGETQQWNVQTRKKRTTKAPPQDLRKTKQLVLIRDEAQRNEDVPGMLIRDHINHMLQVNGGQGLAVSTVETTLKGNIMITTTPARDAAYLLLHINEWKPSFPCQFTNAQLNKGWHKVVVHGVPLRMSHLDEEHILPKVKDEMKLFNGLDIISEPYWLTRQEKRESGIQRAGSIVLAFATREDAEKACRHKVSMFGRNLKVEHMISTPAYIQCRNCQRFGHLEARCREEARCMYCAKSHQTRDHTCGLKTCSVVGKSCDTTHILCANCKEAHTADSKDCSYYQSARNTLIADEAMMDVE